jgi:glycosyltransferase involved in cell wall biosynthesis
VLTQSLRIALFTETFLPKLDGVVTVTCLLLDHLRKRGHQAMIFAPGDHIASYAGYPVVSIPGIPAPVYPELTLALPGDDVYSRLEAFQPDIVHVLNPVVSGVAGMHFAKRLNRPLVTSFHTHLMEMARFYNFGVFEDTLWTLHRWVYSMADVVLATSLNAVDDLKSHGFGDVKLWRRGVDIEKFSPTYASAEMRARLSGGNPEKTLLLSAGRLAPEKQVEQIRHVLDAVPDVHLAIIGDGPYRKTLETVFAGYPVTFVGYMRGAELSTAYASSDIFLFPTSSIETFGLVAAEAMASGVPIVASRVGGMPEMVEQGVNSFMFPENDIDQLVNYTRQLVENPSLRRSMGQRARQTVLNRTWEAIMDELLDVYAGVVTNRLAVGA